MLVGQSLPEAVSKQFSQNVLFIIKKRKAASKQLPLNAKDALHMWPPAEIKGHIQGRLS